jgi:hypothetical protein
MSADQSAQSDLAAALIAAGVPRKRVEVLAPMLRRGAFCSPEGQLDVAKVLDYAGLLLGGAVRPSGEGAS